MRVLIASLASLLLLAGAAVADLQTPLVWPPVKTLSCTPDSAPTPISSASFTVSTSSTSKVATGAASRYEAIIKAATASGTSSSALASVTVDVTSADETLSVATDYSYSCKRASSTIQCTAASVYGVSYALETVAQLLEGPGLNCSALTLADAPTFAHRGLRLDVGHRYFPRSTLEAVVDGMAAFKLNVLNLFFAGDDAVRIPSKKYTDLAKDANGVYPWSWLREFIEYARLRGVRVIPDMDIPARAGGFLPLAGDKDDTIMTFCDESNSTELLNSNGTITTLTTYVNELAETFTDSSVFVGGSGSQPEGKCDESSLTDLMSQVVGHISKSGAALGFEALVNDLKLKLGKNAVLYAYGRQVDGVPVHSGDVVSAGYQAVESGGFDGPLSLPSISNTTATSRFDFYQDFTADIPAGSRSLMLGVSASLWTSAYCKDTKCCPGCAGTEDASFMADRSQDKVFTESVLALVFPEIFPTAGSAWLYQASISEDTFNAAVDRFSRYVQWRLEQWRLERLEASKEGGWRR